MILIIKLYLPTCKYISCQIGICSGVLSHVVPTYHNKVVGRNIGWLLVRSLMCVKTARSHTSCIFVVG